MANKILIEVIGQGQGLDEVNAKLEQTKVHEKELIDQMNKLSAQKQQWTGAAKVVAEFDKDISKVEADLKKVRKEQDNVRKSIEQLSNAQKAMPGKIIAENTAKSFRTLKREIDEQLRTWDDWSATGTEAYNKLMSKAGEMNDTMGDTNRMIQYMGSDTKGFDTLVDGTQAIAGGFSVAQGAMALFGTENEDLQLLMVKLQSAIAISTGLQQIGNVVQKESNLMMGIAVMQNKAKATAELLSTKTTIGATIAQRAFNLVAKANPYVLLAIALITVVGALVAFTSGSNKAEKEQEKLNDTIERTSFELNNMKSKSDFDIAMAKASGASAKSLRKMSESAARAALDIASSNLIIVRSAYAAGNATKEQYEEMTRIYQDASNAWTSAFRQNLIDEQQEQADAAKKASEKRKEEKEKRKQEILASEKTLSEERINAMNEGEAKEIEVVRNTLKNRLSEIKGNSPTEIALRKQLEDNAQKEIYNITNKYKQKRISEDLNNELSIINTKLNYAEKGSLAEYDLLSKQTQKQAEIKINEVNNSLLSEKEKAVKIAEINSDLYKTLGGIADNYYNGIEEKRKKDNDDAEKKAKEQEAKKQEILQQSVQLMGEIGNILFDYKKEQLSQEMSDLEHFYITSEEWSKMSADEKKKNSDKQIISEQELAAKQLEIKRKQAQADKNQSLFNIAMSTAEGAMRAVAASPLTGGMPFLAFVLAMGAVQAAAVLAKPLPKYWKGRKGGEGEFAMVGEHGPELMWIPQMAGIMPTHDTASALRGDNSVFNKWNMPRIETNNFIPVISKQSIDIARKELDSINYDLLASKIGENVGKNVKIPNYPKQKNVTINVDKSGISVEEGNTRTKILNKKYGL